MYAGVYEAVGGSFALVGNNLGNLRAIFSNFKQFSFGRAVK